MQIQVNTDKNISGPDTQQAVQDTLNRVLARFSGSITRLEVHLSDENSAAKSAAGDKRCLLEARLEGRQPVSVTEQADNIEQAIQGAAQKMVRLLDSEQGKQGRR